MSALEEINKKKMGEWTPIEHAIFRIWCEGRKEEDDTIEFLANKAAEELSALRAERDEAVEQNEYLKNFITGLQWSGESYGWLACPSCRGLKKDGHKKDCDLIRIADLFRDGSA